MIRFEKEVLNYLSLPSVPLKEWDGKKHFEKGVAVVETIYGGEAYAVCKFDEFDQEPSVVKVFGIEPFRKLLRVYIVPDYMTTTEEVKEMDLDEESAKNAERIVKEAEELSEDDDESKDDELTKPKNEYYFDHIHTDEEAEAYIRSYNKTNKIGKNNVPKTHEGLVLRLAAIYSELRKRA